MRRLANVPWACAAFFLGVCIGDTVAGLPAVWALIGWGIPVLVWEGVTSWRESDPKSR